jgi:hypothetical protein
MKQLLLLIALLCLATPAWAGYSCAPGHENDPRMVTFDLQPPGHDTIPEAELKRERSELIRKLASIPGVTVKPDVKLLEMVETDMPCQVLLHIGEVTNVYFWVDEPLHFN